MSVVCAKLIDVAKRLSQPLSSAGTDSGYAYSTQGIHHGNIYIDIVISCVIHISTLIHMCIDVNLKQHIYM